MDRFAPSTQLDAKRALYPSPKVLRDWSETPKRGSYLPEAKLSSHELDFWGGDFASLCGRLDYVKELGADVLAPADGEYVCLVDAGCLTVIVPPESVLILKPGEHSLGGYSRYKRVR